MDPRESTTKQDSDRCFMPPVCVYGRRGGERRGGCVCECLIKGKRTISRKGIRREAVKEQTNEED